MCTKKKLYSPSNIPPPPLTSKKKGEAMDFHQVSTALHSVRLLANGWDMSIAEATEKIRNANAFPQMYKMIKSSMTSRQVAGRIRKIVK